MQRTLDEVLADNDFSGERLLGLAHHCALTACRRLPYSPPGLEDQLASFLVEQALVAARRYDRELSGSDYTMPSYLWDIMAHRCVDFFRKKSEGFGDARHGNANRVDLFGNPLEEIVGTTVDTDPFEETVPEAAERLAARLGLTDASKWVLVAIVAPRAEGAHPTEAATEAGIGAQRAGRLVEDLRRELEQAGVA